MTPTAPGSRENGWTQQRSGFRRVGAQRRRAVRRLRVRRWVSGVLIAVGAVLGAGIWFVAVPVLTVGTAYKAKMLCSEVFVAKRAVRDAVGGLAIDDLRALRVISAEVNEGNGIVTTRFLGLLERRARYRGGLGCALDTGAGWLAVPPDGESLSAPARVTRLASDSIAPVATGAGEALDAALDAAFAEPDSSPPRRTRAVVVMQRGAIVAERYAPGVSAETPLAGWSMTKSVLNALVGIAVREGKLALDAPVRLAAWNATGDPRGRITVSDLLRMSSGLAFDEGQADPRSDILRMLFGESDMAAFAASRELVARPGIRWDYSTGTSMILSRVLREALGDEAYWALPREALFDPLGMSFAVLEADASGTFVASSYMYATAREWARFGQLYLQDGAWMGERILPEGWVEYTRTPAPAAPPGTYGAHFWLRTPAEYRGPEAELPADVFQAVGHEGQFITIIPSREAVIVRLGRTRHASSWHHDRFVASILAALGQ